MSEHDGDDTMDGGEGGLNASSSFHQLRREYRNMEMNRKAYADESHQTLRRQQALIEKLKKDNEDIKDQIGLETRHAKKETATLQQQTLTRLQEQVDALNAKISSEKNSLEVLTQQRNIMQHKVSHQRKHMGGVNASKENQNMISKQIRILESRLDKSLVKFNEALSSNKILRENIDNLRRERVVFDDIHRKLERELNEKKKEMANVIEASNSAYEQRDHAQMEIAAIQQIEREEKAEYERRLIEINEKIEEAKHFAQEARMNALHEQEETNEDTLRSKSPTNGHSTSKLKSQASSSSSSSSMERVQMFEEAFQRIQEATGLSDIDALVKTFIKNEDHNFSLFNYVNEQNNEMEKVEDDIKKLKQEREKFSHEHGDDIHEHTQLIQDLEMRWQATEASTENLENKCVHGQKILNSLKVAIQSIFSKLDCPACVSSNLLNVNELTEANLMQYLGVVEQRTHEVLQRFAQFQKGALERNELGLVSHSKRSSVGVGEEVKLGLDPLLSSSSSSNEASKGSPLGFVGLGPATPMGHEPLTINPPNVEDYSSSSEHEEDDEEDERDEDDEDENDEDDENDKDEKDDSSKRSRHHPLTREELKNKALKSLQKKQKKQERSLRTEKKNLTPSLSTKK